MIKICLVLALLAWSLLVEASAGDRDPLFVHCLAKCTEQGCTSVSKTFFGLFGEWPCEAECRYRCMWEVEDERRKNQKQVRQYFGKWPFKRIWGIQEPFSTLFSILNCIPHAYEMLFRRDKLAPRTMDPTLRFLSLTSGFIGINTWVWSTAFHARDIWITERLDYHCATLHMVFYLWFAICRLTLTLRPESVFNVTLVSGVILGGIFVHHVWYMNYVAFYYGWNMVVTGAFVLTQMVVWIIWALVIEMSAESATKDKRVSRMIVVFQGLLLSFAAFEAYDFPPYWDLLDAHAVWHGLTPLLVVYWYMFREADAMLLSAKSRHTYSI